MVYRSSSTIDLGLRNRTRVVQKTLLSIIIYWGSVYCKNIIMVLHSFGVNTEQLLRRPVIADLGFFFLAQFSFLQGIFRATNTSSRTQPDLQATYHA